MGSEMCIRDSHCTCAFRCSRCRTHPQGKSSARTRCSAGAEDRVRWRNCPCRCTDLSWSTNRGRCNRQGRAALAPPQRRTCRSTECCSCLRRSRRNSGRCRWGHRIAPRKSSWLGRLLAAAVSTRTTAPTMGTSGRLGEAAPRSVTPSCSNRACGSCLGRETIQGCRNSTVTIRGSQHPMQHTPQ